MNIKRVAEMRPFLKRGMFMDDKVTYIKIMIESLKKKIEILDEIIIKNKEQKEIISKENLETNEFEKNLEEKSRLVEKIEDLDDGFQNVYNHVKEELSGNRKEYAGEITRLQELIGIITDKGILIQTEEERNKNMIQTHFSTIKKEIKQTKKGRKVASDYYKSMSKTGMVEPQFLDKKK